MLLDGEGDKPGFIFREHICPHAHHRADMLLVAEFVKVRIGHSNNAYELDGFLPCQYLSPPSSLSICSSTPKVSGLPFPPRGGDGGVSSGPLY